MTGLHHREAPRPFALLQELQRFPVRLEQSRQREHELHPQDLLVAFAREEAEPDQFCPDHLSEPNVVHKVFVRPERIDTASHHTLPGCYSFLSPRGLCVLNRTDARYFEAGHVVAAEVFHKLYGSILHMEQALGELRSVAVMPHRVLL